MIPNKNLQIGRDRFSRIVWEIMDENLNDSPHEKIESIIYNQNRMRVEDNYNTGSLAYNDAYDLYVIINYFKPRVVAEEGTFIGVSTHVIYEACKGEVDIHT